MGSMAKVTRPIEALGSAADWFGALSPGAKMRLVLVTVLLVWLTCIAIPAMLISTLAAENVTNLQGAVAFVQVNTPSSEGQQLVEAQATPGSESAQAQALGVQAPADGHLIHTNDEISRLHSAAVAGRSGNYSGNDRPVR